jgi:predicted HAD superfamily Cof-like phosphohydrolase
MIEDVIAFRRKFGHPVSPCPTHLTKRRLAERANAMLDELKEFGKAAGLTLYQGKFVPDPAHDQDLAEQADGLVDLAYFVFGTAIMLGVPWQKHWIAVQSANMEKIPGPTGDVVKPAGWIRPDHDRILAEAGYERSQFENKYGDIDDAKCFDDKEHSR